ncbi:MAG TPA: ABC transporter permease [Pseudonocardiaceae bacterium]|jgi:peptide/nickel transport system permease protein|nr:ABC transporter permease [Pseudonocardiaceae bacterium]
MIRLVGRRLVTSVITILTTSIVVFALRFVLPGGPVEDILGQSSGVVTQVQVDALKQRLGLDRSPVEQYWIWAKGVLHGDLGQSYYSSEPVTRILGQALVPSIELIIGALLVCVVIGGGLGMFAAIKRDKRSGRIVLALTGLGLSIPDFWFATIAAGVFGLSLGIFPAVGYNTISADGWASNIYSIILPVFVLSMVTASFLARHLYNSLVETLDRPYVRTAWATGLAPRTVYLRWALRAAVAPVLTFIPLAVAALISGTVLVENVFNIPGAGTQIVQSVLHQDYNVLQAVVLGSGVIVAVLNLGTDLITATIDPRVRAHG